MEATADTVRYRSGPTDRSLHPVAVRRQLPVYSPVAPGALLRAAWAALHSDAEARSAVRARLTERFGASAVVLCDSGTSALVLALQALVGAGGTVAFPSYACIDLAAAARFAGVRVRLYDLDPLTLSVDLDSLARTLGRGVNAVVAVHLYGMPSDVPAMQRLASEHGVPVIEDAAQGAGGTLQGRPLGSLASLSVLSFGRGKGTTGGNGGALLVKSPEMAARVERALEWSAEPGSGWKDLGAAAAQWMLGRPALYGIPAAIPGLRLGEMVYHPAHEPAPLSRGAAVLVRSALQVDGRELESRRRNAHALIAVAERAPGITPVRAIADATPGYLRLPVLDDGRRVVAPTLGVLRGYPRALFEQEELRPCLPNDEHPLPGGARLQASLFTLPVHSLLDARDVAGIARWLTRD